MVAAVITGDIVGSRSISGTKWLEALKKALHRYGREPEKWEISRGDSFQLEIPRAADVLEAALFLKATIRQIKGLDVRMAIGIGAISFVGKRISESNGPAFIHSGEAFEALKKRTLIIRSPWQIFDQDMNLYLELAMLTADKWSEKTAEAVRAALEHPELNQTELARLLRTRSQGNVSETLARGGYETMIRLIEHYRHLIAKQ